MTAPETEFTVTKNKNNQKPYNKIHPQSHDEAHLRANRKKEKIKEDFNGSELYFSSPKKNQLQKMSMESIPYIVF